MSVRGRELEQRGIGCQSEFLEGLGFHLTHSQVLLFTSTASKYPAVLSVHRALKHPAALSVHRALKHPAALRVKYDPECLVSLLAIKRREGILLHPFLLYALMKPKDQVELNNT